MPMKCIDQIPTPMVTPPAPIRMRRVWGGAMVERWTRSSAM